MKYNISTEDLTFGVEIEGLFDRKLVTKIKSSRLGEEKHDGSVGFERREIEEARSKMEIAEGREIASEVLKGEKELFDYLNLFEDKKNYFWNTTTGLHLHIGTGAKLEQQGLTNAKLSALFENWEVIKEIQKMALEKMCSCQKNRLTNHCTYCRPVKTRAKLITNYREQDKYEFLRFHPQGTLEFRFLCPCKHKDENVAMLLAIIIKYLNEKKKTERKVKMIPRKLESITTIEVIEKSKTIYLDSRKPQIVSSPARQGLNVGDIVRIGHTSQDWSDYSPCLNDYCGMVGRILRVEHDGESYNVDVGDDRWWYPASSLTLITK